MYIYTLSTYPLLNLFFLLYIVSVSQFRSSTSHAFLPFGWIQARALVLLWDARACLLRWSVHFVYIYLFILRCFPYLYFLSVTVLTSLVAPPKMVYNWYRFDGAETNCGIARIIDVLLKNGYGNKLLLMLLLVRSLGTKYCSFKEPLIL